MKYKLKQILLFGCILFATEAFSNIDSVKTLVQEKSYSRLMKYIRKLQKGDSTKAAITSKFEYIKSYTGVNIQIQHLLESDSIKTMVERYYTLDCIVHKNKIIYCWIRDFGEVQIRNKFTEDPVSIFEYKDTIRYKTFSLAHKAIKEYEPNPQDVFLDIETIYAIGCGWGNSLTKTRILMLEFVEKQDYNSLSSWLYSPLLEYQLYAAEGFYLLEQKGYKISKKHYQLIQYIIHKPGNCKSCAGCLYGQEIPIEFYTKKFKFKVQ